MTPWTSECRWIVTDDGVGEVAALFGAATLWVEFEDGGTFFDLDDIGFYFRRKEDAVAEAEKINRLKDAA